MKTKPDTRTDEFLALTIVRAEGRARKAYKVKDVALEQLLSERAPGDVIAVGKRKYVLKDEFADGKTKAFRTTHFARYSLELVK